MDWINIHTSILDSAEFVGADPICRATWLCLLRYCCGQENGGRISGCAQWHDRRWQQLTRVTKREVTAKCDLWHWDGDDVVVNGYPIEKERQVRQARGVGMAGAMARWGKPDTDRHAETMPPAIPTGMPPAMLDGNAEGKGREDKGKGRINISQNGVIEPVAIYAAYPLKVGKADALKAIARTLKAGAIKPDALLAKVQAYAAAVATWPEADRKFVPHPATWINRGSFDDDPATWQRGKPVANGGFTGEVASVRPNGWGTELPLAEVLPNIRHEPRPTE